MTAETLPDWLRPLAELASSVRASQLSPRFPDVPPDARPAAVLLLFSDGLVDGRRGINALTEAKLLRIVAVLRQRRAEAIVDAVLSEAGDEPAADDRTILVLKA